MMAEAPRPPAGDSGAGATGGQKGQNGRMKGEGGETSGGILLATVSQLLPTQAQLWRTAGMSSTQDVTAQERFGEQTPPRHGTLSAGKRCV